MAHFDASDDDWPTSAVDEPIVVFDQSGMRIPAYALEGILADKPVFEQDDPEIDKLIAKLSQLNRYIKAKNQQLSKKLADPNVRAKFAAMGTKSTIDIAKGRAKGLRGLGAEEEGWGYNPLNWAKKAAVAAYDASTDLVIGQSVGTQAKARVQAEKLQDMVEERVNSGQVAGDRAEQLRQMADENVRLVSEPAKTFVKATVEETAKNAKAMGFDFAWMGKTVKKVLMYGIPVGLALYIGSFALRGGKLTAALARRR